MIDRPSLPARTMLALSLITAALGAYPSQPVTRVTDSYPAPSPDGKTLLFQSDRNGRTALYLSNLDGAEVRLLLDSGDDPSVAAWAPDGRRIVFAATVSGDQPDIFVMDAGGTNRRRLTTHAGDDSHPHWSPDGTRIFWNSASTTTDLSVDWTAQWHEIFSMKADGSDVRQHTRCRAVCTFGSVSPDGQRITYRKVVATPGFNWVLGSIANNSEVFVANVDGTGERNLTNNAAFDGWPVWSPDGKQIAFASNRAGPAGVGQVYTIDVDGGTLHALTTGHSHVQPAWSHDGRAVFAHRTVAGEHYELGQIVRVALDGTATGPN